MYTSENEITAEITDNRQFVSVETADSDPKNDQLDFLTTLFGQCSQGFIEIRPLPPEMGGRQWIPVNGIQAPVLPTDKDIYIGVATRQDSKGGKDYLVEIPAVWVDVDFKDINREEADKRLESYQCEPSITVESGGGLHLYWKLYKPATIEDIPKIEDINRRLALYLGGDKASAEAAHILRLPGTYNGKYNPPEPVSLVEINDNTYQLSDFDCLPILPPNQPQATSLQNQSDLYNDLLCGVPEGQRHHTAVRLTSRFNRSGMSADEIQSWLALWNQQNQPPLGEQELLKTVYDVYQRYGQGAFITKEALSDSLDYGKVIKESVMNLFDFIRKEYPAREYILKPLIRPGEVGMISAERGAGKTWLAMGIALAASLKLPIPRWECLNETGCMYIDGEMPGDLLQERMRDLLRGNFNVKPQLVFLSADDMRSQGQPAPRLTSPEWRSAILDYLKEHNEIGLLILDNLASLTPGADENTKMDWDDINQWLLELRAIGKAIIMIHHSGKGGQQRGTSSREDILDFSIKLKRPQGYCSEKGAIFIVEFTKVRSIYGDDAKSFTLELKKDITGVSLELVEGEDDKKEAILALHRTGMRGKEIASTLKISPSYVSQVLKKVKDEKSAAGEVMPEADEPETHETIEVEDVPEDQDIED